MDKRKGNSTEQFWKQLMTKQDSAILYQCSCAIKNEIHDNSVDTTEAWRMMAVNLQRHMYWALNDVQSDILLESGTTRTVTESS